MLPDLTNEDLRELGVARLGDRRRLLAAITRLAKPERRPALGADGERRQVTVPFADLANFTPMSEALGAEATHAILNRYFAATDRIIGDFGGAIGKHIGDNVMAVFGAPVAHDNDPERAVRVALAQDANDRVDIALALGEAEHNVGAPEAAIAAFATAREATGDAPSRCRAWIGLAGAKRITDDLDGAPADLDSTELAARREGLAVEQARVHIVRGDVLFPRGDIDGCIREHGAALRPAREAGSAEIEAAALGGLADADYMRGRYATAFARFEECVMLSRTRGLRRTEVANLPMMAITAMWGGDLRRMCELVTEAIEAARRVGHRRAEMIAHHGGYFCGRMRGDFEPAAVHVAAALAIARNLGARRFEAEALHFGVELDFLCGERGRALENIRTAVAIAREGGMSYLGPTVLGGLFLISDDAAEREAPRVEAEAEA